jgi:hypothetical protein
MRKVSAWVCALWATTAVAACFNTSGGGSPTTTFDAGLGDVTLGDDAEGMDVTTTPDTSTTPEASIDTGSGSEPDTSMNANDSSMVAVDSSMGSMPEASVDAAPEAGIPEAGPVDAAAEAMGDGNSCGTGVISGSEVCSGTNLNGKTCQTVVSATTGGTLACAANCLSFDVSGCTCTGGVGYAACTAPVNGCFDLQTDPNNCGTCGNACGSGNACSVGHCTDILMSTSPVQVQALGLAIDSNNAYFFNTDNYQIYSVPLAGGTPTPVLSAVIPGDGQFLTVIGGTLYWTQVFQGVFSVPVTGGSATTIASTEAYPNTLTNDGTNLFWANTAGTYSIREDVLATSTLSTIPVSPDAGPGIDGIYFFAVDANHLYWGDFIGSGTNDVYQANKDGSNVIVLASGFTGSINGLTIDDSNVYFAVSPGQNGIFQVPIGGGTVTTLASSQGLPVYTPLVTDGQNVYWMASEVVRKTPVGGGPITNLSSCPTISATAPCSGQYVSMAIDSTYVYWVDEAEVLAGGSGTLFKTLK